MTSFTTIDDVVDYLAARMPEAYGILGRLGMRDVVRDCRMNRYEEITEAELDEMFNALALEVERAL
jgi:hypothetical protein